MPASSRWFRVTCSACCTTAFWGPEQVLARLRAVGMLRREKEPAWDLIIELFPTAAARLVCDKCGHQGLQVSEAQDEWDDADGATSRSCIDCGLPVSTERLAAFPDTQRCMRCQQAAEQGEDVASDYCPRCGTAMQLQRRRGGGLAGYQMVCPECRR